MQHGRTHQVEAEQSSVNTMFAVLDEEVREKTARQSQALRTQADGAAEAYSRDLEAARLAQRLRKLRSAEGSLCFGRVDPSAPEAEALHIGRIGLRTAGGDVLLVDWRAEAARPFYSATMATTMGVRRRRHLTIDGREVTDVSDEILDGSPPLEGDMVGDGPLLSALSGARTGRMQEAAATLQSEQDQIVRSEHRGVMVVDGGPGTGKTIVALHRAAYVLYAFPTIADRGVLVFGPNQRFLDYISGVLPSLGENDVQLAATADLVGLAATTSDPDAVARLKGSPLLAQGLAARVGASQPHGVPLTLQTSHGTVTLPAAAVDTARRGALQEGRGHNNSRDLFKEFIVDSLVNELEQQAARDDTAFEEAVEELLGESIDSLAARDLDAAGHGENASSNGEMEVDWDLIREGLLVDESISRTVARVWPMLDAARTVRALFADLDALARLFPGASAQELESFEKQAAAGWSEADLAILDEAAELIEGPPEKIYGHVVIDEAQQLSAMAWRMLMRRCPERSMTVVGDLAQAGPSTTIRSWTQALEPFVQDRFVQHSLTVNYRTTAEILESVRPLLARIAPEQELSRSMRHGDAPLSVSADAGHIGDSLLELVEGLEARHPGELIGVVASAGDAAELAAALGETSASVIPAPDARGLEFDAVIVVDPEGIGAANEAGLRDLYVAQTRATKRLILLHPERVPALIG